MRAAVLVLGATGYVGSKLVHRLAKDGYAVRSLVRNRKKVAGASALPGESMEGDLLKPETLPLAFAGIDAIFYLVHSMTAGEKGFEERDRVAAQNAVRAAEQAGVKRIIYLGGLGRTDKAQSPHLRSRHEVGDILRSGSVPVTELRAAVILGSGSVSFEMVHYLVNRLPVMICPRWVVVNTQPIAIDDVLHYLVGSLEKQETAGRVIDIGGPEVLSYRDMMLRLAGILNLRRLLLQVPLLTPRLSSYWVNLVTPIPASLARTLIDSLRHETICENDDARQFFGFTPVSFETAVKRALSDVLPPIPPETGGVHPLIPQSVEPSHFLIDRQVVEAERSPGELFARVASIGGSQGWLYANWLWRFRGWIDKILGGVGMRHGRRHPTELRVGDTIDFWRVVAYDEESKRLRLQAEMNVWGCAWLEFVVEPITPARSRLIQTARYYPRGLMGMLYWWSIYPLHLLIFRNMARSICRTY